MFHLARRFGRHITATPLSPGEQQEVADSLTPELGIIFFSQTPADQRHALDVARSAAGGSDVTEAALLHDVGKVVSDLGPYQRSLATVWSYTSLPVWGAWRDYLDHGGIGADMLAEAGAGELSVAFARCHPGAVPSGVDAASWATLAEADDA
ncbi:MAG: hypothetical protein ACR2N2_12755 [Acidimicrobiia bacterium]